MSEFTLKFAERCAWRGAYLYRGTRQVARIVLDPTTGTGTGPHISLGLLGRSLRVKLPVLRWSTVSRYDVHPLRRELNFALLIWPYRLQQRILHRLDGRFTTTRANAQNRL